MDASPEEMILLALLGLWVAAPVTPPYEQTQVHMGVPVRIVLYLDDRASARDAAQAAFQRVSALDRMMSDYRPDSELRALESAGGNWTRVSPELFDVLTLSVDVARATDGAFDPTIAPLVALWREARRTRKLPDPAMLATARARVGWRQVALDPERRAVRMPEGASLDLGGIAKGYILQEATRALASRGVRRALIEAGGDIVVRDPPPGRAGWRIDVPSADAAFGERASRLANAAIATSGPTPQFVEIDGVRYSHVIDPRTGLGVTSAWVARVIAENAATADALATAMTVLGPERLPEMRARFRNVTISLARR